MIVTVISMAETLGVWKLYILLTLYLISGGTGATFTPSDMKVKHAKSITSVASRLRSIV